MDDRQSASFAPESPDLSNFYTGDPEPPVIVPQHQGYRGSISLQTPYTPGGSLSQSYQPAYSPTQTLGYAPPTLQPPQMPPRNRGKREYPADDDEYVPQTPLESTDRLKRLHMDGNGNGSDFSGAQPVDMGIVVKTKFPVARIKRIMQADDDVGKVAQVTPVVVSKALELFMINLVTKAAAEAKQRSQKRVAATHLKQAIIKDSQFDFLEDIVSKVPDAPVAAEKNDEDEPMPEAKKPRKASGRRKKKEEDSD